MEPNISSLRIRFQRAHDHANGGRSCVDSFLCLPSVSASRARPGQAAETLNAVVGISAKIQEDARSAETLGLQRSGSGAIVRDGYVLTIGYLVIEAEAVQVTGADGRTLPATVAAYDHASGFALLKVIGSMPAKPLALGDSAALGERDPAMAVSASSRDAPAIVYVVSRRAFSGNWEYLLDSAIFTYPPVMDWSGAPLIGASGELLGIGSLIVPDAGAPGTQSPGNMFVPVDLLKPILEDLIARGGATARRGPGLA